jgi:hypothetical protein
MCLNYNDFFDAGFGFFKASPIAPQSLHRSEHCLKGDLERLKDLQDG